MTVEPVRVCDYVRCANAARATSKYCSDHCRGAQAQVGRVRIPPTRDQSPPAPSRRNLRPVNRPRRPRRFDHAEILRLLGEPGSTQRSVARIVGCSLSLVDAVRATNGVPPLPARRRTPVELAASRADRLLAALHAGGGPFALRDVERRFSCGACEAARVLRALADREPALVTWEPARGPGGVRLVAALPVSRERERERERESMSTSGTSTDPAGGA
jgi:hypothetical protein